MFGREISRDLIGSLRAAGLIADLAGALGVIVDDDAPEEDAA